jgi:hypothetical protein
MRTRSGAWTACSTSQGSNEVFLTIDPDAPPFWLTRDYLPEIRKFYAARAVSSPTRPASPLATRIVICTL